MSKEVNNELTNKLDVDAILTKAKTVLVGAVLAGVLAGEIVTVIGEAVFGTIGGVTLEITKNLVSGVVGVGMWASLIIVSLFPEDIKSKDHIKNVSSAGKVGKNPAEQNNSNEKDHAPNNSQSIGNLSSNSAEDYVSEYIALSGYIALTRGFAE